MRKFLAVVIVLGCCAIGMAATEKQATVMPVLDSLQLEKVPSNVIGGPVKYKVTKKTVDLLSRLLKDGGTITLEGDGSLKITEKGDK